MLDIVYIQIQFHAQEQNDGLPVPGGNLGAGTHAGPGNSQHHGCDVSWPSGGT